MINLFLAYTLFILSNRGIAPVPSYDSGWTSYSSLEACNKAGKFAADNANTWSPVGWLCVPTEGELK